MEPSSAEKGISCGKGLLTDAFRDRYMELNLSKQKMLIVCGMLREKKKKGKMFKCSQTFRYYSELFNFVSPEETGFSVSIFFCEMKMKDP